jgi:hypothetical protein
MRASFNFLFLLFALILAASSVMADGAKDGQHHNRQPKVATITDTAVVVSTTTNAVAAGTNTVTVTSTTSTTSKHKNAAGKAEVPAVASVAALAVAGLLLAAW